MSHNPVLSIITVVLNGEKYLEQCIKSVISQKNVAIEYIIIDGESSDGTVGIIKKYDTFIHYWISEKDDGISHAFNKGIEKATGDLVCFLNSDDFFNNDALTEIAIFYLKNKDVDIIYANTLFLNEKKEILIPGNPMAHLFLFYQMSLAHPSIFFTRRAIKGIGLYDTNYCFAMDYDYLIRALIKGFRFKYCNQYVSNFRMGGLTSLFFNKSLEECKKIRVNHNLNEVSL